MAASWRDLLVRQQGLATRGQLTADGLTRAGLGAALADGTLHRVDRGLYRHGPAPIPGAHLVSGGLPDPSYVTEVRRVLLTLGERARAARRTAAVLWGFDLLVEPTSVEVDVPHGFRVRAGAGVGVQQSRSVASVLRVPVPACAPVAVTSAVDTVLDCCVDRPLLEAVVVADSALRAGAVRLRQLRRAATARRGLPFTGRIRAVLRWCDARSGSVLESALRVVLCQAGLVPPSTQHDMVVQGVVIGRVDFAWPLQRLVIEADGRRWHDPCDRRDADRRRDNTWARLGWTVLRFTWAEVLHAPDDVVSAVREALARGAAASVASEV